MAMQPGQQPYWTTHWIDTTPIDSNDKPCVVRSLVAEVRVSGLYAEVTETLGVQNPNRRDIAAELVIPLPDRATVSGYALDVENVMVDGVIVEKDRARVIFETEQRRGIDPGLVEAVKGNVYRTRVYPVPAHRTRIVRLRYIVPLLLVGAKGAALDLPMPVDDLITWEVHVDVDMLDCPAPVVTGLPDALTGEMDGRWHVDFEGHYLAPNGNVRIALPELPAAFSLVERDEEGTVWFCASEQAAGAEAAAAQEAKQSPVTTLKVLWDASGSRADADHAREIDLLRGYCADGGVKLIQLLEFSDHALAPRNFSSADELADYLQGIRYDGGTNFAELVQTLSDLPLAFGGIEWGSACVLFTDGLDTITSKPFVFPEGWDVLAIVSGAQRDAEALRQACKGHVRTLEMAPQDIAELGRELACSMPGGLRGVQAEGVADLCDAGSADGVRRAVIGRLVGDEARVSFEGGKAPFVLRASDAKPAAVLARAWAAKRVSLLSPRATDNVEELLALGKRFGVVSPATSLLVLETLEQYLEHDVEPPKTLKRMHHAWEARQAGRMRVAGAWGEPRESWHRKALISQWKELLEWWQTDFTPSHIRARQLAGMGDRLLRSISAVEDEPQRTEAEPMPRSSDGFVGYAVESASEALPDCAPASAPSESAHEASSPAAASTVVNIKRWMPDTPYLSVLDEAADEGIEAARVAYHEQRREYCQSPAFFLDCAGWFMEEGDAAFGLRVLSNLAELRIEDAALLRVFAWRLREAGELEQSLVILRRVQRLRSEDSQSYRDLALVLDELARKAYGEGNEAEARAYAEEAGELYRKIALTPWERHPMPIALFAVEEYNVFRAWADRLAWDKAPELPSLGEDLEGVLSCDLRITLAWDADETDIDIHVTEPTGEEAYYANRRTHIGGRVSEDIVDGYGPELYEIRKAMEGDYLIRAHYFASHQQVVFGPATCTLTVYTDWGGPEQEKTITTTRLDQERQMVPVGKATFGATGGEPGENGEAGTALIELRRGMTQDEVRSALGEPDDVEEFGQMLVWMWKKPDGRRVFVKFAEGVLAKAVERAPWGEEMVLA